MTTQLRGRLEGERERLRELLDDLTGDRPQGNWTGMLTQPGISRTRRRLARPRTTSIP